MGTAIITAIIEDIFNNRKFRRILKKNQILKMKNGNFILRKSFKSLKNWKELERTGEGW